MAKNLQSLKSVQNFACDVLSIYDHIPLYCSVWFGLEQRKYLLFREQSTLFREARFREMVLFCGQNLSCFHFHWFSMPENRVSAGNLEKRKWNGLKSTCTCRTMCTANTFCTPVRLVRMVHVFSGRYHFYRNGLCRSSMPTNPLAYLPPPILTLLVYSMLYRLSFCLRNEQKLFWERLLKALSSHHSL